MMSIDQGKPVLFLLLNLSAALDTVDDNAFFSRLEDMFGLSGKVFEWFRSYLEHLKNIHYLKTFLTKKHLQL